MGETQWMRHRFQANEDDWRPIEFPPPGPYWCTGYGNDYAIVVAYLPAGVPVQNYWPEAEQIDSEPRSEIVFTDRFPAPKWWLEKTSHSPPLPDKPEAKTSISK